MNAITTTKENHDNAVANVRKKQSALASMAARLQIAPANLQSTLRNTVFQKANDDEFAALIIVANEYGLNPLTKEIYAFPSRGGIQPIVSVDGWIRIMNEHPQFDGIEFEDIVDGNKIVAIEAVIHRKDRKFPIKVTEYLDECKQGTDPWKKWPSRMLRHKALIQGARLAFGFSGIHDGPDEAEVYLGGDVENMKPARIPSSKELRQEEAEAEGADTDTGEIVDQEPLSEDEQREIDEELDAKQAAEERGEAVEDSPFDALLATIVAVSSKADLKAADEEFQKISATLEDDQFALAESELSAARKRLDA